PPLREIEPVAVLVRPQRRSSDLVELRRAAVFVEKELDDLLETAGANPLEVSRWQAHGRPSSEAVDRARDGECVPREWLDRGAPYLAVGEQAPSGRHALVRRQHVGSG